MQQLAERRLSDHRVSPSQNEKAYQKQFGVNAGFKSKEKKAPGHSGHRFYRNVGLGFKTPQSAIEGASISQ